jgi:hypothetical protein
MLAVENELLVSTGSLGSRKVSAVSSRKPLDLLALVRTGVAGKLRLSCCFCASVVAPVRQEREPRRRLQAFEFSLALRQPRISTPTGDPSSE